MKEAMKKTRLLKIIICILVFCCFSCDFGPGAYPYAERYSFDNPEADIILAVEKFKTENPEYCLPQQSRLKDGRRIANNHWYYFHFYYQKENEIVKTWVRPGHDESIFAFLAINTGLKLGNWNFINKDYSYSENKRQKKKFEKHILDKVREILKRKR